MPKGVVGVALSGRGEWRREGHPSLRGIHIRRTRVRTVQQLDKMIAVQFATFQRGRRLYTYVAAIEQSVVSIVLYRARDPRIYASRRDSAKSFPVRR